MCPLGRKRDELIHYRYQLKPILYERVYPPEYEMAHNRRFGPWVDPDCHTRRVSIPSPYFNVFDVVRQYHKSCRRAYFKQCKEAAPKPDAVSSQQLHSETFKTISDFINTEMIQNNKVMLVSSAQDLYEAEYCSLGGREDDIAVYSIQALTRKLKDTFEDKIFFDPTDGLDPEKYGWKMENGCLVPDWFDGPVIPADLFHDKEDTDVDTGDQQAVDDAEYDDGSSTDSEWSDESVESDSD
ncbi:hypothetical protein GQR58_015644 [Nymphon striatum]|nr:hypothetical protein GQR58_015644 [Nymphon striatum]